MKVVFARTRYTYDSYQDFWKLVELAGYETCHVDEIDSQAADVLYVTTPLTGELRERRLVNRKCLIAWWNLERPDGEHSPPLADVITECLGPIVDDVWVSDRHYQRLDSRMRYVPLGSHRGLAVAAPGEPADRYDVAHLSYVNGRRNHILGQLAERGLRIAPNAWDPERAAVIRDSTILLNVHQTPCPVGEPLRFALAAAHGALLVSETCADPHPLESDDAVWEQYHELAATCDYLRVLNPSSISPQGGRLQQRLCDEWRFPRGADEAARALWAERRRP